MGKSKKHRSPSPEWKNLEAQCLWPEQIAYEIIRPCELEKRSIAQRAVEVGLHPRTIARKLGVSVAGGQKPTLMVHPLSSEP